MNSPESCATRLSRGFRQGVAAYGSFELGFPEFARSVLRRAAPRLDDHATTADILAHTNLQDLYLAVACDLALPGAWRALYGQVCPMVARALVRRGMPMIEASHLSVGLPGHLLLGVRRRRPFSTYAGRSSIVTWLLGVALRRLCDKRRQINRGNPPGRRIEVRGAEWTHAGDEVGAIEEALAAALSDLPWRQRRALVLYFEEGHSQRTIAETLGVSQATVSRLVAGAVARLEGELNRRDLLRCVDAEEPQHALAVRRALDRIVG